MGRFCGFPGVMTPWVRKKTEPLRADWLKTQRPRGFVLVRRVASVLCSGWLSLSGRAVREEGWWKLASKPWESRAGVPEQPPAHDGHQPPFARPSELGRSRERACRRISRQRLESAIEYSISARSALLSAARRTARGQQLAEDLPFVPICTGEGRVAFDVPLGIAGNNFART